MYGSFECFIAVAEERNFGRAAARLHMTQPPLTRRITRLEREIGAQLFVRTRAGADLTGAGLVLLERAHRIVELSRNAVERTRLAGAGQAGTLAVGYMGSTVFDVVPRLLRQFLEDRPLVRLEIEQARKDVQADAIRTEIRTCCAGRSSPTRTGVWNFAAYGPCRTRSRRTDRSAT
jgi:DNA-binding transcriptional LysR family regulator